MKSVIRIAGSFCILLLACLISYSPAVPADKDTDAVPVLVDDVLDYNVTTEEAGSGSMTSDTVINTFVPNSPTVKEISSLEKVTENVTVREGKTLVIKKDGILYIDSGCTFCLRGTLKIEQGGEVYIRGTLDTKDNSSIYNSGKIKILSSGAINLDGTLSIPEQGTIKGKGTINVLDMFSDIRCKGTITSKICPPEPIEKDGVTYVGGVLLVNKKCGLPKDYGSELSPTAYSAFLRMKQASGYDMSIISGYRSYAKQKSTFEYWCSIDGYEAAVMYSALPGHSEHQTGLAIDVTSLDESYAFTEEGKWLAENCYKYGFIIRYPKDKTDITGYVYEPWHIRYLGASTAKLVYDSGLTLEEFLGVT